MDSLDAQCLVMGLVGKEIPPPDLWRHDRSGGLSCAYEGGERSFTWPAEDVAEMARRWRASKARTPPDAAHALRDAHLRLEALVAEAGLGPPDRVIHYVGKAELRAVWGDAKVVLVIDKVGETE